MILGVGTDIIEIDRIKRAMDNTSGFLERIFTDKEIKYLSENSNRIESIAGNFAVKEAVSKALGTGIRGFTFKEIEVFRDNLGKPVVKTYNNLKQICIDYSVLEIKVSISHTKDYAAANAITITA